MGGCEVGGCEWEGVSGRMWWEGVSGRCEWESVSGRMEGGRV